MPKLNPDFETDIAGIPCGIVVDYYLNVPPWRGSAYDCPSDWDYYGYTEFEFTVVDRKGYRADWLAKKLTPGDEARIREEYEQLCMDRYADSWDTMEVA